MRAGQIRGAALATGAVLAGPWSWPARGPCAGAPATRRPPSGFPGDEVVERPRYQTTHAVAIRAPPSKVSPWVVQLAQGRGGLYGGYGVG